MAGTADKAKGRIKETVGEATDNDSLKREGKSDRAAGAVKGKLEEGKDKAEDVVDSVKDKLHRD